jgi:hypothetical protein
VSHDRRPLLDFAEDHLAYIEVGPDEERISDPRFVLLFTPGRHFWSAAVGRVRFDADIDAPLAEIRSLIRARCYEAAVWTVGTHATPSDLVAQLVDRGLEHEGTSDALLLSRAPKHDAAEDLEVRTVHTLEDHVASIEVAAEGFGFPADDRDDALARAEASFRAEQEGGHTARLLAFDGDRPVATGRAWVAPMGLYVGGGATLPSDRGRGAMTSLLVAAWDDAVRRGTPAVVTYGGAMSGPILVGLGFEKVGEVTHLIDRVAEGGRIAAS